MANHQVPRAAKRLEQLHGIDADGNVITCVVFRHLPRGHEHPIFYVVQYRERNRKIDPASRITLQFSGFRGWQRMEEQMKPAREQLASSRVKEAARIRRIGSDPVAASIVRKMYG